ncbi:hypothetical protein H2199_005013 [Coniosporium tulheliwenetii]|uniref:Uncharacterized protein n=1 Tax=Coniosporium tulheliwenetii TaxID=3383036 RepID=A0ACC2Z2A8_9PEZI|nr:hypothetical protein H2199_005013 [Cladosporium sp. JES 115]
MSGLQRMPVIAGVAGIGTSLAVLASIPSFRQRLSTVLGLSAPGGIWRVLAILFALLNLKSLPFVWHSNSTYFSDLDISRTHLVTTLLRSGIRQLGRKPQATQSAAAPDNGGGGSAPGGAEALPPPPANGRFAIALGGITCHFRREIAPYQKFEIHTRLLCWDRKWLYLPWKKGKAVKAEEEEAYREKLRRAVFASSIAKYVVKKGRLTIPPEDVLRRNGLLPPRPNEAATTSTSSTEGANTEQGETISNGAPPEMIDALDADDSDSDAEWTWEKVEAERVRGMKLAELFAGLDGLHEEFTGGRDGVLGEYPDLLW